ncbi:MAG: hypothetical protein MMC23_010111, partial [Stictis urceolatum]|nr:hypothetical protein [Stictis urceolata]
MSQQDENVKGQVAIPTIALVCSMVVIPILFLVYYMWRDLHKPHEERRGCLARLRGRRQYHGQGLNYNALEDLPGPELEAPPAVHEKSGRRSPGELEEPRSARHEIAIGSTAP